MPLVRWCSNCWSENPYEATVCGACGASLCQEAGDRTERLIRALGHPMPEIRRVAAGLLGRRDDPRAVAALAESARQAVEQRDWELVEGIIDGLGASARPEALQALTFISQRGAVRTRHAARRALAAMKRRVAGAPRASEDGT
jgi:HEAT repeat protein